MKLISNQALPIVGITSRIKNRMNVHFCLYSI